MLWRGGGGYKRRQRGRQKNEKSTPERALLRRAGPLLSGRAHDRYRGVDNKNTDRLKG